MGNEPIEMHNGFLDYSFADFPFLIKELEALCRTIDRTITELEQEKIDVERLRTKLKDYDWILSQVEYYLELFPGIRDDLKRISNEIPVEVHGRRIKTLSRIFNRAENEDTNIKSSLSCVEQLDDEEVHNLVNNIYKTISNLTYILWNQLGYVEDRLEMFEGKRGLGKGKKEKLLEPLNVPEGTAWREVNIRFTTWQTIRIKVGSIEASRTYPELGLEDNKKGGACPKLPWLVLARIAKNGGEITFKELPKPGLIKGKVLKSHIMKLNKIFYDLFPNIEGRRPFTYYRKEGKYRAWFGNISMNKSCDPESEGDILLEIEDKFNTTPPAMGGDDIRAVKIRR